MRINPDFLAPCGLYCGVCAVYIAHRDNNLKFKERLVALYQGKIPGKGALPDGENLTVEDIRCRGCLSEEPFLYCRDCEIRNCTKERGYSGCHQCPEFPCRHITEFPMAVGRRVILRAVPHRREVGTEKWVQDEEARYICPRCGHKVFRGVVRCNQCKEPLDLD